MTASSPPADAPTPTTGTAKGAGGSGGDSFGSWPFVSAVIDCDGTPVRGNLINVEPDPDHVSTGMRVRLATYSLGSDDNGTEAVGFGFEPTCI